MEAIEWLKENNIRKDDGSFYEKGEDIPEGPERLMTDKIGEPIMLNRWNYCNISPLGLPPPNRASFFLFRFPAHIKAFYMARCSDDPYFTESVDVLLPNVGEIIGGSMRIWDHEELLEAYKKQGLDASQYYWYTDQRKFGTCEHGGYGLGVERFLCWVLGRHHIREVCLYPRFMGRCKP